MAKCDLTIELDDPDRLYTGGEVISGVVRVDCDADVNCKGLEVKSVWRTHGRGNIDTGEAQRETLFAGQWSAGEKQEYRFELAIADWPPSYHGNHLNVDHYIDARALIPWGFDPQASVPFVMRPSCGAEDAQAVRKVTQLSGVFGPIVSGVVLAVLVGLFIMFAVMGPFIACMFVPIALIGGSIWFVRSFLPRYLLGEVELNFAHEALVPGQSAKGELIVRPKKNVSINAVTLNFQAREQCVSGSGSNRTTHKHVFFENAETLQDETTLTAGQQHTFPFSVTLPSDAPYSIDLKDNELIWSSTLRIDIPRWPDWKKEIPLLVVPSADGAEQSVVQPRVAKEVKVAETNPAVESSSTELTFYETATHIASARGDRQQLEALVEAVTGLSFEIAARVERRLLYSGDDDPHVYENGYAIWAYYPDPKLPLVLYVPHDLADEFEQIGSNEWRGRGMVVGWDSLHQRLQVKVESPQ